MSVAVCVGCGETKEGAFEPCDGCGLDPARGGTDRMLQARSLLLSERFFGEESLKELGRKIRTGEPVSYDTGRLSQLVEELKTQKLPVISRSTPGCSIVTWSVLGMLVVLAAGLAYLYGSWRH
ncbi:hypothetical protein HUA74_28710 [Myxococcus sp. CA051A]|uniref:Uncharacterized protein n=1 Tax=Myxococcus llanfairpwllgwyngyllgogerychwyrndrobwllllantysiliogogogochensis TaxID=2590453 RepID=A0A540X7C8_9BACT|nr:MULTISPECIES: hypothetical protein [Myxococcus]NTX05550.1 hypothetical protein [Myxococcus sp. CA040A]NTX10173.1 hypothetical protein [Myxococcus sp. CA056]NTX41505.1 hypothetical protein [Myxococcus sp. CA033]NTX51032.1 hypothetical protein [Myxococcus sp. CA039A]NTX64637.1 hypothetical protein [Myxococcus sp. CA051A]